MNIILMNRGDGKSTSLIYRSNRTNAPIVCIHPNIIKREAYELGVTIPEPISAHELMAMRPRPDKILVDDLDIVLQRLLNVDVDTATMTPDYTR